MSESLSPTRGGAHVIVVGNEKGGSGKTTVAMHLAIGLIRTGDTVQYANTILISG